MNRANIAVIGDITIEHAVQAERMPRPGEEVPAAELHTAPGGRGANQAIAAARLGAMVTLIGRVGGDGFGAALVENLKRESVNVEHVTVERQAATGVSFVTRLPGGHYATLSALGANLSLHTQHVETAAPAIERADLLLAQFGLPLETVDRAMQIAVDRLVPVLVDATPTWRHVPRLWRRADLLVASPAECHALTGVEVADAPSAAAAAERMRRRGVAMPVIPLGTEGCVVATDGEVQLVSGYNAEAVDAMGADDAFAAALGVRMAEGATIQSATVFANAAAALAMTTAGSQPSLPTRRAVEEFIRRRGGERAAKVTAL
jgi:ribokinase